MLFYLFVYTLATFAAFAVVVTLTKPGRHTVMIDELSGLWATRPWLALAMAVVMLALLGFPVFGGAGFFAKWYVLQAALTSPRGLVPLSVVLVLTSVVSAGYYLHIVRVMFMRPRAEGAAEPATLQPLTRMVLVGSVVLLLVLGLFPGALAGWAKANAAITPPEARNPFPTVPIR